MSSQRNDILDWAEQGRIAPENVRPALELSGALPDAAAWRRFLDRLMLWSGCVMLGAAVVFFFAYNWAEMGRQAKIGLVQLSIVAALAGAWRLGLDRAAGKAALFTAALLVGALFALIGQIYQTGADPWELFAAWGAAILPWALLGRLPVLWLLCIALANLAFTVYFLTFGRIWGFVFAPDRLLWLLFAINTAALVVWEFCAWRGVAWLRGRWPQRLLATASGGIITSLAVVRIAESTAASGWAVLAWLAWMAAAYGIYRHVRRDLFVLSGGVLSAIFVTVTFVAKTMFRQSSEGGFLLLGMLVIGMSAAGAWWLKRIALETEEEAA